LVPRPDHTAAGIGFTTTLTAPLPGQIRQDPSERRLYLGVADVTASLNAVKAMGDTVEAPRFEVPGVVVLDFSKTPKAMPWAL
jgi:predicted enzyme related to lactoylglutathione lyase